MPIVSRMVGAGATITIETIIIDVDLPFKAKAWLSVESETTSNHLQEYFKGLDHIISDN